MQPVARSKADTLKTALMRVIANESYFIGVDDSEMVVLFVVRARISPNWIPASECWERYVRPVEKSRLLSFIVFIRSYESPVRGIIL